MGGTDKNDQMTRLHKTRRHHRWPRRLLVKFITWAVYNSYVIFQSMYPEKAKSCTFRKYIEQYSLELVGIRRVRAVDDAAVEVRLQNVGLHHPCIPDYLRMVLKTPCVLYAPKKYNKLKKAHPNVAHKDNPVKAVKSAVLCKECKVHLCVKRGSTCWSDWHTKVEYWH